MKKPTTLPMVEKVLRAMNFQVAHAHNYEPKGVISHRRVQGQRSAFVHSMIPDLCKEENSLAHDFDWSPAEKIQAPQEEQGTVPTTPLPLNADSRNRRSFSEVVYMECDEHAPGKKTRIHREGGN